MGGRPDSNRRPPEPQSGVLTNWTTTNLLIYRHLWTELNINLSNVCQMLNKNTLKYPKIKFDSEKRVYVTFYLNNKRYRLFNGQKINCDLYPNSYPIQQRLEMGNLLAAEAYKFINSGLTFNHLINTNVNCNSLCDIDLVKVALDNKIKGDYSEKYKSMLKFTFNKLSKEIKYKTLK